MRDVAIVGAGELGGSLAHVLARRNTTGSIHLVDETGRVAEGKALDISQAAPIESSSVHVSGSSELSAAAGATVVVVADRVDGTEWQGSDALTLVRRLAQLAPGAILLFAGARHRDLVERSARELGLPRRQLIGSAPEAFSAATRAIVALEADASARDVALVVVGNPPHQVVMPWEAVTIGGLVATEILDEPARRRVVARLPALWPPGPYALASAAAKVIGAITGRSRQLACCFVAPDDSSGRRSRTAALPVALGASGIERVVLPRLNARDRVVLDNAMAL